MFGLAELARLKLYESTLRQAKEDARELRSAHNLALSSGLAVLGRCVQMAGGGEPPYTLLRTITATLRTIPSSALNSTDAIFLRSIKPGGAGHDAAQYQILSLLNALVFVRVVEVARPMLASRARRLQYEIETFLNPIYASTLDIIASADRLHGERLPREKLTAALRTLPVQPAASDNVDEYCVNVVATLVAAITREARPERCDTTGDPWAAALFTMVISSQCARILGAQFELVASLSLLKVLSRRTKYDEMMRLQTDIIPTYNQLIGTHGTIPGAGEAWVNWLNDPCEDTLRALAVWFERFTKLPAATNAPARSVLTSRDSGTDTHLTEDRATPPITSQTRRSEADLKNRLQQLEAHLTEKRSQYR